MQTMRESWTDERLDDLNGHIREGFGRTDADLRAQRAESIALRKDMNGEFAAVRAEMKAEFAAVRAEMKAEFAAVRGEMKAGFGKVEERFDKVDERFVEMQGSIAGMQRTMMQGAIALSAAMAAGFAALVGVVATQF
jgi:hypothetical protein